MDELGSLVDNKGNQQWVCLALDGLTREIVAVHIGDRSAVSAIALWNSMGSPDFMVYNVTNNTFIITWTFIWTIY